MENNKKIHYTIQSAYASIYEEKDHEVSMIRSELKTAMDAISRLQSKMKGEEKDVEAWVQSKITKAADYLQAAANYIDSGESEVK
jgi:ribosomal protein S20